MIEFFLVCGFGWEIGIPSLEGSLVSALLRGLSMILSPLEMGSAVLVCSRVFLRGLSSLVLVG